MFARLFTRQPIPAAVSTLLPHTSLDLTYVADLMPMFAVCIVPSVSPDCVEIGSPVASVRCTVTATRRQGPLLTFTVRVSVAGITTFEQKGLKVTGADYRAIVTVCGLVFRKSLEVWMAGKSRCLMTDGPQRVVDETWPPVRVLAIAVAMYMHTYNERFSSATCSQRTTVSLTCVLCSPTGNCNLHVEYKADGCGIVVTSRDVRVVRAITFVRGHSLTLHGSTGFKWTQSHALCLPCHVRTLWRVIATLA